MYIVNTTYLVESVVADIWSDWVKACFVPALADAEGLMEGRTVFTKVIAGADSEGETFSLQLFFTKKHDAEVFTNAGYQEYSSLMEIKFPGKYLLFQTILEIL